LLARGTARSLRSGGGKTASAAPRDDASRRAGALGFGFWLVAAALAFGAQYSLVALHRPERGAILYVVAMVLAIMAGGRPSQAESHPDPVREPWPRVSLGSGRTRAVAALAVITVFAVVVSVTLLAAERDYGAAFPLWITALAAGTAAASLASPNSVTPASVRARGIGSALPLLGVLVVAAALRLPGLASLPADVHGDEAACGIEARLVLDHGNSLNVFDVGWAGLPHLAYGLSAPFMAAFGDDLYGLRTASAFFGIASVLLTFLLAGRLFSERVATVAAFLLAAAAWHVHFSRTGFHYVQATFATVFLLYFAATALETKNPLDFLLAGFGAGLCWIVYFGARLSPLIAALYVCHRVLREPGLVKRIAPGLAVTAAGVGVFLAPFCVAIVRNPLALLARSKRVWLFAPGQMAHELHSLGVHDVPAVVGTQLVNALSAFNWRGETSVQYGHGGPLLDFWTAPFFVLGVAYVTARVRDSRCFLIAAWFWLVLVLGGALTVDALFSPRVVALVPAIFLVAALAIDTRWERATQLGGEGGRRVFGIAVGALLLLALGANVRDYFLFHAPEQKAAGFHTLLSRYLSPIRHDYRVFFFGGPSTFIRYDTERFLIPDAETVDMRGWRRLQPLPTPADGKGIAFVIDAAAPDGDGHLEAIRRAYPNGRQDTVRNQHGGIAFRVYLVPSRAQLDGEGGS
jgi:4-amino-4-deoxy-L-arabinose transferase-like glycosyltransferase